MDISAFEYMVFAKTAAEAVIAGGSDLSTAIAKVASERELSQVQIQRVIEMANHEVNDTMRKMAEDKTFFFDVATLDAVLGALGESGVDMPKTAAAADIRMSVKSYVGREDKTPLLDAMAKEAYYDPYKMAVRVKTTQDDLVKIAETVQAMCGNLDAKIAGCQEDIRRQLGDMTDHVVTHLGNHDTLLDLKKFACSAYPDDGKLWDVLFDELRDRTLSKLAQFSPLAISLRKEAEVASDKIDVEVINGQHGYLVELDTLKNKISEEDRYAKRRQLLGTLGPAVVKSIKSIRSSKDVDAHISEDIEEHRKIMDNEGGYFKLLDKDYTKLAAIFEKLSYAGHDKAKDLRGIAMMAILNSRAGRDFFSPKNMLGVLGQGKGS